MTDEVNDGAEARNGIVVGMGFVDIGRKFSSVALECLEEDVVAVMFVKKRPFVDFAECDDGGVAFVVRSGDAKLSLVK